MFLALSGPELLRNGEIVALELRASGWVQRSQGSFGSGLQLFFGGFFLSFRTGLEFGKHQFQRRGTSGSAEGHVT